MPDFLWKGEGDFAKQPYLFTFIVNKCPFYACKEKRTA